MAAVDKMYVHGYYEYDDVRKWAIAYYPELVFYMYRFSMNAEDYFSNREEWLETYKEHIMRDYKRLGKFKTKPEAVQNLIKHYKETADYDCPLKQAKEEVDYCLSQYEKLQAGDYALEDDYTFPVMNTPIEVDRKLLWICPVPCVRKYLEEQCGYKTRWYHKIFWRGKKHFT